MDTGKMRRGGFGVCRVAAVVTTGVCAALLAVSSAHGQSSGANQTSKKPNIPITSPSVPLPLGLFHGALISKGCASPQKVGDTLSCDIFVGYNDDFGDTLEIQDVFDVVNPGPSETIIGNLEIVGADGNTTAFIGGSLPVRIGPPGSTLGGLPGSPLPGVVTFRQNTYVIQLGDPDPLPDQANVTIQDFCDAPGTAGCSSIPNTVQFTAATDIANPGIDLQKTANPTEICPGPPATDVTYDYVVTNTGDIALENILLIDDGCGPVIGPTTGDVDTDGIMDLAEEFIDLNSNTIWDPGEPIIQDNGNGVWDDTEVWTFTCTAALNGGFTNTATVSGSVVGLPSCVAEDTAQATVTEYPRPVATPDDGAICAGQDTTICANPSDGLPPFTFDWSGPGGFTANTECITVDVPGVYCVILTDANGCTGQGCGTVTLNPNPNCSIFGPIEVCQETIAVYTGPAGMASYAWSIIGDGVFVGPTNQQAVQVMAGLAPGSYTVTLNIIDTNGCPNSCDLTVNVIDCTVPDDEPGWNWVDNVISLTGDQPTYWSALSGLPSTGGLAPFTSLDPGFPPGRPAMDGTTDRVLRGYAIAWAVDSVSGNPITWNHLSGLGTIVNYRDGFAWEYGSWNFRRLDTASGIPLLMDGVIYAQAPDLLLFNFQAVGSSAWSGPRSVISSTDVTLHPVSVDLRQENDGPVTTKADFSIWNMNEVKFSETHRCVTCWDQQLLGLYGTPNSFLLAHLQTDHGKARVDGKASQLCNVDVDPTDGPLGAHPDDVISTDAAMLGVTARLLAFDGPAGDAGAAGSNMWVLGCENASLNADPMSSPPPEGPGLCGERVSATEKGSLLYFSKIELRWDSTGFLVQDTFLSLTNDYPGDVTVQLYFINGDAPITSASPATDGSSDELLDLLRTIDPDADDKTIRERLDQILEQIAAPAAPGAETEGP
ncbi:MAG: hypothetical protein GY715_04915 [Planctomycetes bacterium]|nr:hypothetical protein [Planctomycetota bacterium]